MPGSDVGKFQSAAGAPIATDRVAIFTSFAVPDRPVAAHGRLANTRRGTLAAVSILAIAGRVAAIAGGQVSVVAILPVGASPSAGSAAAALDDHWPSICLGRGATGRRGLNVRSGRGAPGVGPWPRHYAVGVRTVGADTVWDHGRRYASGEEPRAGVD